MRKNTYSRDYANLGKKIEKTGEPKRIKRKLNKKNQIQEATAILENEELQYGTTN